MGISTLDEKRREKLGGEGGGMGWWGYRRGWIRCAKSNSLRQQFPCPLSLLRLVIAKLEAYIRGDLLWSGRLMQRWGYFPLWSCLICPTLLDTAFLYSCSSDGGGEIGLAVSFQHYQNSLFSVHHNSGNCNHLERDIDKNLLYKLGSSPILHHWLPCSCTGGVHATSNGGGPLE